MKRGSYYHDLEEVPVICWLQYYHGIYFSSVRSSGLCFLMLIEVAQQRRFPLIGFEADPCATPVVLIYLLILEMLFLELCLHFLEVFLVLHEVCGLPYELRCPAHTF